MVEEWNIDCRTVERRRWNSGKEMTEGWNSDDGTVEQ